MEQSWWPPFGISVIGPRLELRPLTDDDLPAMLDAIGRGIQRAGSHPFPNDWPTAASPQRELDAVRYHWKVRAEWSPSAWRLEFGVHQDGRLLGVQGVGATEFAARRTVASGSWLSADAQGTGAGTEMRAMMLHFAFAGLGADRAESGAFADNGASLAVTQRLGYAPCGDQVVVRPDGAARMLRFALDRPTWEALRRTDIEITGLEPALTMFGLEPKVRSSEVAPG